MENNGKVNPDFVTIHSNYNNRALQTRHNYKSLFQWTKKQLILCQASFSKCQTSEWSAQIQIIEKQQSIIQSMLLELAERIKIQCKEKGELFLNLFQHTIRTINRMKRLFELNICEHSKKNMEEQDRLEKKYESKLEYLQKERDLLQKQKQHKWRNLYMIIKDNRVLRRQKGKLLRKHKEQVWRAKHLEQDLIFYRKQNQKKKLLIDSYREEQDYHSFIEKLNNLNVLQKKIKLYPQKARKLLKNQLIQLEINQLKGFDKKIKTILKAMEKDQIYDDYDDWEQNLQPVTLYYNISTQTYIQYENVATNTPIVPPKTYESSKTQTKAHELIKDFKITNQIDIPVMKPLAAVKKRVQRKTKNSPIIKMSESGFSKLVRRGSIFDSMKRSESHEQQRRKDLGIKHVFSFKYQPKNRVNKIRIQEEDDENSITGISRLHTRRNISRKKLPTTFSQNFDGHSRRNIKDLQIHLSEFNGLNEYEKMIKLQSNVYSIAICQSLLSTPKISRTPLMSNRKIPSQMLLISKEQNNLPLSVKKTKNSLVQINMNNEKENILSILRDKSMQARQNKQNRTMYTHKRQKTQQYVPTNKKQSISRQNNKGAGMEVVKNEEGSALRYRNSEIIEGPMYQTFSNFEISNRKQANKSRWSMLNVDMMEKEGEVGTFSDKYLVGNLDKLLATISKRKKELLQNRPTFLEFVKNFYYTQYSKIQKADQNFTKFTHTLRNFSKLSSLAHYRNLLMTLLKLIDISNRSSKHYEKDIFALLVTMISKCEDFSIPITALGLTKIRHEYGIKIIEYICSVYWSPAQTSSFIDKYGFNEQIQISLWNFLFCFQRELESIISQSQLSYFIREFIVSEHQMVEPQELSQLLYIFKAYHVEDSILTENLNRYAKNSMPVHRIILYAHRYEWKSVKHIESHLDRIYSHLNLQRIPFMKNVENIKEILEKNDRFPRLGEKLRIWRLENEVVNGQGNKSLIEYCRIVGYEQLVGKYLDLGFCLSILTQAYAKVTTKRYI